MKKENGIKEMVFHSSPVSAGTIRQESACFIINPPENVHLAVFMNLKQGVRSIGGTGELNVGLLLWLTA